MYGIKVVDKNFNPTKEEMQDFAKDWINKHLYWIPNEKEERKIEEEAIKFFKLYKNVKKMFLIDSFLDNRCISAVRSAVDSAVSSAVYSAVSSAVYSGVSSAVRSAVYSAVSSAVRSAVDSAVYSGVGSAVYSAVGSAVGSAVRSAVYSAVYSGVYSGVGSYYWSNYFAFFSFFHKAVKNPFYDFSISILGSSGMMFIQDDLYIVRKPVIKMKDGRLHSEESKAIEWRDGAGFYFIDGVHVNEIIACKPETLTKDDWKNESNLEVRRIIQERMGSRFLTEIGGKTISKHEDKRIGEIVEIDITPDPEKTARYLHAQDWSTNRMYFLRIPPTISNPMEAQAWSYSNGKDYVFTKDDFEKVYLKIQRT